MTKRKKTKKKPTEDWVTILDKAHKRKRRKKGD